MSTVSGAGPPQEPAPVIFGEVLFDCFPDGSRVLGGAPFNVAWHLQAMGARPQLISAVGNDEMGREIRTIMNRWGLSTSGLQLDPGHATGQVRVSLKDGQPSFDIVDERAYDHIRAQLLPTTHACVVYHGSLALRGPCSAAALDALLAATAAPVFIDVNLRDPWWQAEPLARRLDRARWVKLNHHELQVLHGERADVTEAATRLLERHGLELIIVTMGADGALLVDASGTRLRSPAVHGVQVVDTVGAGDAFAAVCVLGLMHGWPLATTAQRAQRFASMVVAQRGATKEDLTPYRALMRNWNTRGHPGTGR